MGAKQFPQKRTVSETTSHGERQHWRWKCQMWRRSMNSRRFLDLRRDGWELENVSHLDAAMLESSSRVHQADSTGSTWDLCRAQGAQGLGCLREFVGNIADDPMTKNIQTAQGVMTRSSVKVCRAHQLQSSRTLTTSAAVCREP